MFGHFSTRVLRRRPRGDHQAFMLRNRYQFHPLLLPPSRKLRLGRFPLVSVRFPLVPARFRWLPFTFRSYRVS